MMRTMLAAAALLIVAAAACMLWRPASTPEAAALSPDLYPLYARAQWGAPVQTRAQIGAATYAGAGVSSAAIDAGQDPSAAFTPFEEYYDQKLKALGWSVADDAAAGGHTGGQTGYRKGGSLILIRFSIEYQNNPPDAPSECPCSVTLSLFAGT